jgi:protein SCO1/2
MNFFRKRLIWPIFALIFAAGLAAGVWYSFQARDVNIQGVRYFSPPIQLDAFHLKDFNLQDYDNVRLQGHWTVLFFGYTHCPDICPTVLMDLTKIYNAYEKLPDAPSLQVVFISVDPNRDSSQTLKDYVSYFSPDFLGATGERKQIDVLTQSVGAMYDFEDSISGELLSADQLKGKKDYTVNHYSSLILLNPQGKMVAHIYPPHEPQRVLNALKTIINI